MSKNMILRHDNGAIAMHWFNALCWIFLTLTGLGLIQNQEINPLGAWYPELLRSIFGSGEALWNVHVYTGLFWALACLVYILLRLRHSLGFVKEVFSLDPVQDTIWMLKKNIQLTLGNGFLRRLGFSTEIPPQGFYNAGQKLFAQLAVLAGLILLVTGIMMVLSTIILDNSTPVAWARTIHYLFAGLAVAGLIIHVYMAAISREERPALKSMLSGYVPEEYARHHHELWYQDLSQGSNL
ncbi:MAG: cytochrome b/b6 domain-containing protein [Desulfohalobiaceae bacterium]